MTLHELKQDMEGCARCSHCKWVPHLQIKSWRYAKVCPSVDRYHFHSYSGGGKMNMANSYVDGRSELSDTVAQVVYRCQLCGACQVSCQCYRDDIDLADVLLAFRSTCVEQGYVLPEHLEMIESMKREDNTLYMKKADRGKWADGLDLIDINTARAETLFHAGCRYSYDEDLRDIVRSTAMLFRSSGVRLGIAGKDEACCGGRAYQMGFKTRLTDYADDFIGRVKASGARTVVVMCSDCNGAFKHHYARAGKKLEHVEILHISEYLQRLVREGRVAFKRAVPMKITYHDPCNLGRMGEPGIPWQGEYRRLEPHIFAPVPEKPMYIGLQGCYEPPREILKAIPGIELIEMERNRINSWCCGAGAGALEAYEDFAAFSAAERIDEARSTGAEALVTACPWCERNFKDTLKKTGQAMGVYDIMELVDLAMGGE